MIIPRFEVCPICVRKELNPGWKKTNHNTGWWEYACMTHFTENTTTCDFSQYFFNSYEDLECKYIRFNIKDYTVYLYSDNYGSQDQTISLTNPNGQTYFYHIVFPRGENVQGPFQIWDKFIIDWDNLDNLNNKLNLYKTFE